MQVVQVDYLDAETEQRGLAPALDVGRFAPPGETAQAAVHAHLGRQLHLVSPDGDGPSNEDLVVPGAVDVDRVDEGHPAVDRPANGGRRLLPVGGTVSLAHANTTQSQCRHRQATQIDRPRQLAPLDRLTGPSPTNPSTSVDSARSRAASSWPRRSVKTPWTSR